MFYIFEMANNHMGSVDHGLKIIDEFSALAKKHNINAGIKFQFRQLDTFIHMNFQNSDLKFIKRFKETELNKEEFNTMVQRVWSNGLVPVATPFDNESLEWLEELDIPVVKIASCSIDDWILLEEVCKVNKKIIISTGGADMSTLHNVYKMFKYENRDFAFMHCVGEYPTPNECANLNRITQLRKEFPDIEVGFSTHESPKEQSLCPVAVAMGCTIIEKHVGVADRYIGSGNGVVLNDYSCGVEDIELVINGVTVMQKCLSTESLTEKDILQQLKRGLYLAKDIQEGETLGKNDIYCALPVQEDQLNASSIYSIIGQRSLNKLSKNSPIYSSDFIDKEREEIVQNIIDKVMAIFAKANIHVSSNDPAEISCHYGLNEFFHVGVLIVEKVNREYCKKLLCLSPNQRHPVHRHIKKEETFELLYGDCELTLGDKKINMKKGYPVLISRETNHSFKSGHGAIVEEVSTKHYIGDSIYEDPNINKLSINDRKININL